jgi:hypothetical protein
VLTTDFGLFFIGRGRRQIRGVDNRHGLLTGRHERQNLSGQLLIDDAQSPYSGALTKLVKHSHIRRVMPVMEMSKAPPVPLLWKQADQGVETVCRG